MSQLSFSGYGGVDLPVEVRREDMSLVRRALTSDTVSLEPGAYVVLVRFPDGQQAHQWVQVQPGQKQNLSFYRAPRERAPSHAEKSARLRRIPLHLERSRSAVLIQMPKAAADLAQRTSTRIACYAGNALQGSCQAMRRTESRPVAYAPRRPLHLIEYRLHGRTRGMQPILQVAHEGTAGVHLLVPADACAVDVWLGGAAPPQLETRLQNKSLDATLRFLWRGDCEAAVAIALRQLQRAASQPHAPHPIYLHALLRANALEPLGEWVGKLQPEHGADGAALQGEFYARAGQPHESLRALLRLPNLGLPVFTEGFVLTINRLRTYVAAGDAFPPDEREAATTLLHTLSAFEPYVDYSQPILTYTGRCPDEPGEEAAETQE